MFYRKGFQYDNMFDWTVLNLQQERSRLPPERPLVVDSRQSGRESGAGGGVGGGGGDRSAGGGEQGAGRNDGGEGGSSRRHGDDRKESRSGSRQRG